MRLRWPPAGLGLGTPLNLAWLAEPSRKRLVAEWWLPLAVGIAVSIGLLGLDRILFAGASLERVRALGSEPIGLRLAIMVYSAVREELFYRLGAATLVAWAVFHAAARAGRRPRPAAEWTGTVIAAVLFGLAHVANLPEAAHPVLRAVVVNGPAGIALGWLYWRRGLEAAIVTHMVAIFVLYVLVPPFL